MVPFQYQDDSHSKNLLHVRLLYGTPSVSFHVHIQKNSPNQILGDTERQHQFRILLTTVLRVFQRSKQFLFLREPTKSQEGKHRIKTM